MINKYPKFKLLMELFDIKPKVTNVIICKYCYSNGYNFYFNLNEIKRDTYFNIFKYDNIINSRQFETKSFMLDEIKAYQNVDLILIHGDPK